MRTILVAMTAALAGCSAIAPEDPVVVVGGRVVSAAGSAIGGARVELWTIGSLISQPARIRQTVSDASGAFRLEVEGEYRCDFLTLAAEASGYWGASLVPIPSSGVGVCEGAEIVLTAHDPIAITTDSLPPVVPTVPYAHQLLATGGDLTFTWSLSGGALPPGLSLNFGGLISGVTTVSGAYTFTVQVADGEGMTEQRPLAMTVVNGTVLQPHESCTGQPGDAIPTFEDEKLREAVRNVAGVTAQEPLSCDLLAAITTLDASYPVVQNWNMIGLESLAGIQNLANVSVLDVSGHQLITDIGALSDLTSLTELSLGELYEITDLSPLSGLTELVTLSVTNMTTFDGNALRDLTPLSGLVKLTYLYAGSNQISDLSPLSGLPVLATLDLSLNDVTDLTALGSVSTLTTLDVAGNQLFDVGPLSALTALDSVDLGENAALSDVQPLLGNTGIGSGDWVRLFNTAVSCADVSALRAKGVTVDSACP